MRTDLVHVVPAATALLAGPRFTVAQTSTSLPPSPGLYAVYASAASRHALGLPELEDDGHPIYVGKSESSLRVRDSESHFKEGKTGHSTLRRSIAALMRESHGLRGRPRNPSHPAYFSNFGLSDEHEAVLQAWVEEHLAIAAWPKPALDPDGKLLERVEASVIRLWAPPLNDTHNPRKWAALRPLRKRMANDAEAWTAD